MVGRVWRLSDGVTTNLQREPLSVEGTIAWSSMYSIRAVPVVRGRERTRCENRKVYGVKQRFNVFPRLSRSWAEAIYLQPWSSDFCLPEDLSPEHLIALGCAGPTSAHDVIEVAGVTAGDTVVVQGSGPVGIASAIYAHLAGASRVILVGRPAGRLRLARKLGVGDVHIDISEVPRVEERVRGALDSTP